MELRKGTAKEIVLKADRTLCARMIVIAEARQLSMKEVLSHPLGLSKKNSEVLTSQKSCKKMLQQLKVSVRLHYRWHGNGSKA